MADTTDQAPTDLIGFLDFYLVKKAPFQLPDPLKEILVKFGPWLGLLFLVMSIPAVLFILGISTAFVPFAGYGYASGFGFAAVFLLLQFGLLAAALPGLFARKMSGWTLLFYSQILGFIFRLMWGAVLGALISLVIGLYLLFQVRSMYK